LEKIGYTIFSTKWYKYRQPLLSCSSLNLRLTEASKQFQRTAPFTILIWTSHAHLLLMFSPHSFSLSYKKVSFHSPLTPAPLHKIKIQENLSQWPEISQDSNTDRSQQPDIQSSKVSIIRRTQLLRMNESLLDRAAHRLRTYAIDKS
jgi:hypothetical protein